MLKMKGLLLFFNYLRKNKNPWASSPKSIEDFLSFQLNIVFLCNCGMFLSVEFIVFTRGDYYVVYIVFTCGD